jgi:hypothetical protein
MLRIELNGISFFEVSIPKYQASKFYDWQLARGVECFLSRRDINLFKEVRAGHWTKMRRFLGPFSGLES